MTHQKIGLLPGLCLVGLAASCGQHPIPSTAAPETRPVMTGQPAGGAQRINSLIDQLAISDDDAAPGPIYTPSPDAPKTDKRLIAYRAGDELSRYGLEAFPSLLNAMNDRRQSVAFRRAVPSTVGDACYCILMWQIYDLPEHYRGSFFRPGSDGKSHERPVFSDHLFDSGTIKQWLADRPGRSLPELQLEAVSWVLAGELRIGVQHDEDQATYILPLQQQCDKLRAQIAAAK
jgi:hypothetical protein